MANIDVSLAELGDELDALERDLTELFQAQEKENIQLRGVNAWLRQRNAKLREEVARLRDGKEL